MPSLLCVSIPVTDPAQAAQDAVTARDHGADLVEFRIDDFFTGAIDSGGDNEIRAIRSLVSNSPLPCIVTCRTTAEGGHYDGDDDARISLFEHLTRTTVKGQHPPRYIDLELSTYARSHNIQQKVGLALNIPGGVGAPDPNSPTALILSLHDTNARPNDLLRKLAQMYDTPAASIVKVAYRARSLRDSLELLDLHESAAKPTIALGMGEFGLLSRVLAPKFNGFLTFATLNPATATAPGQPTIRELLDLYRFRSINRSTHTYGVIGYPVAHSLSPLVHNAGFDAHSINAVYLPLPIAPGDTPEANDLSLKATLLELINHPRLDFKGASVTLPFKESLVRLAKDQGWHIDETAAAIGAANTLALPPHPTSDIAHPTLTNTDAPAIRTCLEQSLGTLSNKHIAIIGAGGVARAAAYATAQAGAHVSIHARNQSQSEALVQHLKRSLPAANLTSQPWDTLASSQAHAFINATPVGMKGGPSPAESPIPSLANLRKDAVIFDTVYAPLETPLLRAAKAAGLATIDGASLFTRQAAAQFELWTNQAAPLQLFETLVREQLARQEAP